MTFQNIQNGIQIINNKLPYFQVIIIFSIIHVLLCLRLFAKELFFGQEVQ